MSVTQKSLNRIHFIAIGGSAMHNLAIALKKKGCMVSGSDDEIFEPSKSRLSRYGLLPATEGWVPEKITMELDAIILGMHAKKDNPELIKAKELGIRIYSYPEFLYTHARNKTRIVIGGSHGKTTITAMILHVLHHHQKNFDYMVGAQLEGFEVMVKLTDSAQVMILEGDEYLTSPDDPRPKFHVYQPDIGLISGIAWDHINVFPTIDSYIKQFEIFSGLIPANGTLVYCSEDETLIRLIERIKPECNCTAYGIPEYIIENGQTKLIYEGKQIPLLIFGKHNLMNMEGARKICNQLDISNDDFFFAISSFKGASKRLELIEENNLAAVYKDFAHSPSKVKATISALKEQYPLRQLAACLELHTFSSLNKSFLAEYKGTLDEAETAMVYYNDHTIVLKRLNALHISDIYEAFGSDKIQVFTDSGLLQSFIKNMGWENKNLLLMSSGNFDDLDLQQLAADIIC